MSSDDRSDFDKDAYEHAWRMFDKHATQRIQCLNFYIVVLGGLSAAAGAALSSSFPEIALVIVTFLSLLFVEVFRRLEARNKELVKISEHLCISSKLRLLKNQAST